ncbi:MAG: hypothetical protein LBR88_02740 [Zoogloeaceae bacterium]|jgi:hypothetical protein|nr:hypothetical protein [Zoogloeaceae bacterium]
MDSMANHYSSGRRICSDDACTPGDVVGKHPDRAATLYAQRVLLDVHNWMLGCVSWGVTNDLDFSTYFVGVNS